MSRKYLAKSVLSNNLSFQVVYHKYITDNHFHLQIIIKGKLHFFAVQVFEDNINLYDARNNFLHNIPKSNPAFKCYGNALNKPNIQMDAIVGLISINRDVFARHRPGINSLTTPDGQQNVIYDVSDIKEAA